VGALDQAVALGQQKIIGLIYRAISFSHDPYAHHDDLLSHVVCRGLLNALKYLYKHGSNSVGAVEFCFLTAAQYGHIHILRFFLDTGRVTNKAFGKAFIEAASYAYKDTKVFLHGLDRASSKAITKVLQVAARKRRDSGGEIVKLLFDKGNVSEKDAITGFETAAGYNNATVVKLLLDIASISDEIAINALKVAATRGHLAVVNTMRFEPFVSADIISDVFLTAVQNKRESVVKALVDDERTSRETVTKAFGDAGNVGCTRILRVLNAKQNASPELLGQFLRSAASRGHVAVVKYLSKTPTVSEAVKTEAQRYLDEKLHPSS
jgi:ankyrin repeat protein